MAHTGPAAGSAPRTLRGQAIKLGTAPAGFMDAPSPATYDTQAGVPIDMAHGENTPNPVPNPTISPVTAREPFKLGK